MPSTVSSKSSTSSIGTLNETDSVGKHILHAICTVFEITHTKPRFKLAVFVSVAEFIQFYTFCLTDYFTSFGPIENPISYLNFLREWGSGSLPAALHEVIAFFGLIFLMGVAILGCYLYWAVETAHQSEQQIKKSTKASAFYVGCQLVKLLYLPLLHYFDDAIHCTESQGFQVEKDSRFYSECWNTTHVIISLLFAFGSILLIVEGCVISVFSIEWIPRKESQLSAVNGRFHLFIWFAKTMAFIGSQYFCFIPHEFAKVLAFGLLLILLNVGLLAWEISYLPFHQLKTNLITIVMVTISSIAVIIRTFSSFSSGSYVVFILFIIFQLCGGFAALFFGRRYILKMYKFGIDFQVQDSESPHNLGFEKEFEVEIAARRGYYTDDETLKEESFGIFIKGVEIFPQACSIRLAHAIFMLSQSEDCNMLAVGIQRIKKLHPPLDFIFLIYCLDVYRKHAMFLKDSGLQEISESLRTALRYQEKAKKCIRAFWGHLIKEQNLSSLRDIVANIEHAEEKAEGVYQKLLRRFPKSPHLHRAYGQFCEEVKNDFQAAQESFRLADELEEEKSKRHTKRKVKQISPRSLDDEDIEKQSPMLNNFVDDKVNYETGSDSDASEPLSKSSSEWTLSDSKLNQIGLTSTKQTTEIIRARRRNMVLQRVYRERIQNTKSNALKKLGIAVKVNIATLLADILILFIASLVVFNAWGHQFNHVCKASRVRTLFYSAAINSRDAQLFAQQGNIDAIPGTLLNITQQTDEAESYRDMLNQAQDTDKDAHKYWTAQNVAELIFIEDPPSRQQKKTSLDDLMLRMIQSLRIIASFNEDQLVTADWNKDFRYLFDNCPRDFTTSMANFVAAILKSAEDAHSAYYDALMVCLPLSVCLLAAVALIFFFPAQRKIKQERKTVLQLFVSLPKSILTSIYSNLSPEKDEDIPRDSEEEADNDELAAFSHMDVGAQGMPILKKLTLQYFGIVLLFGSLIVALVVVGVDMKSLVAHHSPAIRYMNGEQYTANRLIFLGREYVLNDNNTWEGGRAQILDLFNQTLLTYIQYHTGLRHGSKELGIKGGLDQTKTFRYYYFEHPCSFRDSNATCKGLEALYAEMVSNSYQLMANTEEDLTLNNTYLLNMLYLAPQIMELTHEMSHHMELMTDDFLYRFRKSLGLILAFSIPALVISYFVLKSSEKKIKKEDERTMKMLLMIPADLIDNVPVIRDYLNGVSVSAEKSEEFSSDIVARNKSIVEGSVDAVIVIDHMGIIQLWNSAACKLFGFAAEEAIGRNIKIIIPDEIAQEHDKYLQSYNRNRDSKIIGKTRQLTGKHKDGHIIPLSISLSEGNIGGKTLFCGFLRDISDVKKWENELKDEKEKSQQLLFGFLPQYIATQLIHDQQTGTKSMIAEAFKEVTVIFADIVGFTKLSSKVSPSQLIHLLNTLFSRWDSLCEKHKVEKIKTIGDCYMAACGVPERCVDHASRIVDFAQDMLESLQELNRETNSELELRIGVNTGSVVAGVIGTRKMAYDLWGDAVNVASRMESSGIPGRIQVSQTTYELLKTEYLFEERGRTEIKGKGTMLTYLVKGRIYERTSSGHQMRRAAMTPVQIKHLRSSSSSLQKEPLEMESSSTTPVESTSISPKSTLDEESDAESMEMVELEPDTPPKKHVTISEDEAQSSDEEEEDEKQRTSTPHPKKVAKKSASTSDIPDAKKALKPVRKNSSLQNASAAKGKSRSVKFQ